MVESSSTNAWETAIRLEPLANPAHQIRLLRIPIDPHAVGGTEVVVKTLSGAKQEGTDDKSKYTALSYVWGATKALSPIVVHGEGSEGPLLITWNLRDFLQKLKSLLHDLHDQSAYRMPTHQHRFKGRGLPYYFRYARTSSWANQRSIIRHRHHARYIPIISTSHELD